MRRFAHSWCPDGTAIVEEARFPRSAGKRAPQVPLAENTVPLLLAELADSLRDLFLPFCLLFGDELENGRTISAG